ncbi:uncharacterized protein [Cherax quadricarinatus]|uniref:uncharacterized protein n=1 Tax=Cherax quadricarinatus TaxID=27406 RepID=UPI00237940EA|nr:uncharacterized protein LOC128700865 [Cherax quadricarinatus]XP_053650297.1 uncharacterized protein LOC128700865 [Cherax quadricarinatus]XP_053650298.1 uncharacterized protein LOC128700865 [Cherax quadricarinatus]
MNKIISLRSFSADRVPKLHPSIKRVICAFLLHQHHRRFNLHCGIADGENPSDVGVFEVDAATATNSLETQRRVECTVSIVKVQEWWEEDQKDQLDTTQETTPPRGRFLPRITLVWRAGVPGRAQRGGTDGHVLALHWLSSQPVFSNQSLENSTISTQGDSVWHPGFQWRRVT